MNILGSGEGNAAKDFAFKNGSGESNAIDAIILCVVPAQPGTLGSGEGNAIGAVHSAVVSAGPGSSTVNKNGSGEGTAICAVHSAVVSARPVIF